MSDGWPTDRVVPQQVGAPQQVGSPRRAGSPRRGGAPSPRRRGPGGGRRRLALVLILAVFLGAVAVAVAYPLRHHLGLGGSAADFDAGHSGPAVVVRLRGSNNSDFAQDLVDAGVVKSAAAFNGAAADHPISAGFYELPTRLPASEAVTMIVDPTRSHRVGMLNVTPGMQLDDKKNAAGVTTKGILTLLSEATVHTVAGQKERIPASDFAEAAATASPAELGVPAWATAAVAGLKGDHRRIEGLIAPGAWDQIDPTAGAADILKSLITVSSVKYESQGLLAPGGAADKLNPYEVLIMASIVEREVRLPDDYSKVARVILNRLAKGQKLEMDSTINYTETVPGIDVVGEQLLKKTEWNTYGKKGLPATPIGAVGDDALRATEEPADGNWLYFVTVDQSGTTLFTDDFAQHERNRQKACDSKFLTTGCK